MCNQKGSSLIELLIMISVISLITTFVLLQFTGTKLQSEFEQLKDQLQMDINWARHYADIHQKQIVLKIAKDDSMYFIQNGRETLLIRKYDKRFKFEDNLTFHELIFDLKGQVTNFGHIKILVDSKLFATLHIQMHTGAIREERH